MAATSCRHYISNDLKTAEQLDNVSGAAMRLAHIAYAIYSNSDYLLGFKRNEISPKAIEQLSHYVSFLTAVLDHVGDLPKVAGFKKPDQSTSDLSAASQIIKSILNNGIVDGSFAKFITNAVTQSCDGHGSALISGKQACIVWHSNGEYHPNYNFSEEVAENSTSLSGHHSPLSVSLERPSENIENFPGSVDCNELARRLSLSAIVIMRIPVKIHDCYELDLCRRDPIIFSALDSPPNVWMCEVLPAEHIHKIIVPSEMRNELDKDLPPELLDQRL